MISGWEREAVLVRARGGLGLGGGGAEQVQALGAGSASGGGGQKGLGVSRGLSSGLVPAEGVVQSPWPSYPTLRLGGGLVSPLPPVGYPQLPASL